MNGSSDLRKYGLALAIYYDLHRFASLANLAKHNQIQ